MAKIDETYREGLFSIFRKGYDYEDPNRKGVQRKEITKFELRHDLSEGFPALTTKEAYFKGAVQELLFFLSGKTDIRNLWDKGVHFWDKDWANFHGIDEEQVNYLKLHAKTPDGYKSGDEPQYTMGKIYPYQYRNFNGRVDQIQKVLDTLRVNPMSTSMIVNAWNPDDLDNMCLPPCHYGFQIVGRPLDRIDRMNLLLEGKYDYPTAGDMDKILDNFNIPRYGFEVHWQQRSTDFFLGTPINVQYYAVLAYVLELLSGHKALAIQGDLKNVHLYDNQFEVAQEQKMRDVTKYGNSALSIEGVFETLRGRGMTKEEVISFLSSCKIDEFLELVNFENFQLLDYESFPKLKASMLSYDK